MKPNFDFERYYWDRGYVVVGVDEVGRGAVAGAVVACAAASKYQISNIKNQKDRSKIKKIENLGIDDSKRLTRKERERLEPKIKKYFCFGIGEVGAREVNKFGIVKATRLAMKRAIKKIKNQISKIKNTDKKSKIQIKNLKILIDGRKVRGIGNQEAIVKGDQKSISIAAASIIAKVYRDNLMRKLSGKYRGYGFERHVGYGTRGHVEMIEKYGVCKIHRKKFVKTTMENQRSKIKDQR